MNFKLIASDLDWTIVYDRNKINKDNLEYIKKYLDKGLPFVIITGRPLFMCKKLMTELGLDKYPSLSLICYNGMVYYSYGEKKIVEIAERIPFKRIKKLHDFTTSKELNLLLYFNEKVYVNEIFDFQDKKNSLDYLPLNIVPDIFEKNNEPLLKAIIASDHERIKEYVDELNELYPDLDFYFSQRFYLEVMQKNVNKGTALDFIKKKFNISFDEMLVFGDSENDLFMLDKVKNSFAPFNAEDEVKQKASRVLKDVRENNFKSIIKEYFEID